MVSHNYHSNQLLRDSKMDYTYYSGQPMTQSHCELSRNLNDMVHLIAPITEKNAYEAIHNIEIMQSKLRGVPVTSLEDNYFS